MAGYLFFRLYILYVPITAAFVVRRGFGATQLGQLRLPLPCVPLLVVYTYCIYDCNRRYVRACMDRTPTPRH